MTSHATEHGRPRKLTGVSDGTVANELRRSPQLQGILTKLNKDAKKWSVASAVNRAALGLAVPDEPPAGHVQRPHSQHRPHARLA